MKIKNKFLTILSSVFGVAAICGLFCLSFFNNHNSEVETKADSEYVISSSGVTGMNYTYYGNSLVYDNPNNPTVGRLVQNSTNCGITFDYYLDLVKVVSSSGNKYRIDVTFSATFYSPSTNYDSYFVLRNPYNGVTEFHYSTGYFDLLTLDYSLYIERIVMLTDSTGWSPSSAQNKFYIKFNLCNKNDLSDIYYNQLGTDYYYYAFTPGDSEPSQSLVNNFRFDTVREGYYNDVYYANSLFVRDFSFAIVDSEYDQGYDLGYSYGYAQGYSDGNGNGFNSGYDSGYTQAYSELQQQLDNYYTSGYNDGFNHAFVADGTVTTIFSGILQVAMVPINFFLAIFNFEILGINISGFISALFTVALTIIVVRTVLGGKGGGD